MNIAILSDLHIDQREVSIYDDLENFVKNNKDVSLYLHAGDITNTVDYSIYNKVNRILENNDINQVIYVKGNHDYYCADFSPGQMNDRYVHTKYLGDNTYLLYVTLWTNYFNGDPLEMFYTKKALADFLYIKDWTVEKQIEMFEFQKKDLFKIIDEDLPKNAKILIMTHHAPSVLSIGKDFYSSSINGSFVNQLENEILDRPQIKLWVHGHVHQDVDEKLGECRIIAHPRGYYSEKNNKDYKPLVIEI